MPAGPAGSGRCKDAGQDAGGARLDDGRDDRIRRGGQRDRVAPRRVQRLCRTDRRLVRQIRGKRHIDRPAVIEGFGDEPLGFEGDVLRCHDARAQTTGSVMR